MGWRSVLISQPARLAMKNRQLLLEQEGGQSACLPLEDLVVVVLETPQATITSALLSQLAAHDVAVITCDERHHPNGVLLPFLPHSRALKVMQAQLGLSLPQKKRAWQSLVQQKLHNQAHSLNLHRPGLGDFLAEQAARVRSGDSGHHEASGARYYFLHLFGPKFSREQAVWINHALNYGYSILRAAIARSLVCHGFLPAFGLHHKNQLNAFNLADDLIEPLRPLVDIYVRQQCHLWPANTELSPQDKAALLQCLYQDVLMPSGNMTVLAAIDQMIQSLGRFCLEGELAQLDWPRLPLP